MAAENFAVSLTPPPSARHCRPHAGDTRQPGPRGQEEVCLPLYLCGFSHGDKPARPGTRDRDDAAGSGRRVCRPYGPAEGARHRDPAALYRHQAARRRATLRALRARRRLAVLLMLAGLFAALLALRGLAPGLAETLSETADAAAGDAGQEAAGAGADAGAGEPTAGDLTLLLQRPALPNGCETVSMAMLMDWAGCPVDPVELFGGYIPHEPFRYAGDERYGPDPETAYAGNAASERNGWYCFEGPAAEGANACLLAYGSARRARIVTGLDEAALAGYLEEGVPLAVWVTRDYEPLRTGSFSWILPDGSRYTPCTNLHCVVLAGRQADGRYRIADPLDGWQTVDPDLFRQSFEEMGRRAVVIE